MVYFLGTSSITHGLRLVSSLRFKGELLRGKPVGLKFPLFSPISGFLVLPGRPLYRNPPPPTFKSPSTAFPDIPFSSSRVLLLRSFFSIFCVFRFILSCLFISTAR